MDLSNVAVSTLVVGIVAVLRGLFGLPDRITPAVTVLVGVISSLAMTIAMGSGDYAIAVGNIIVGIMTGLAATGLYENGKAIVKPSEPAEPLGVQLKQRH